MKRTILEVSRNEELATLRVTELHSESLRLATELTGLGVQCRLTATDFLLLRVASPKDAGNFLTRCKVPVENLDGYPQMKRYIRYYIGSPRTNDRLLEAFRRMPAGYYRKITFDSRAIAMKRGGEHAGRVNEDTRATHSAGDRRSRIHLKRPAPAVRLAEAVDVAIK